MRKPCTAEGCELPKRKGSPVHCDWHWLAKQPIDVQIHAAQWRLGRAQEPYRARVKPAEWPEGRRWCAGCQSFVPLFYARGSRCRACASQASYASHVSRTYELDADEYQQLLEWQGGRCYVCGQAPRSRRLAVDHDHRSGAVRGLLCAGDDWGCNRNLARLLGDLPACLRLVEYVERAPLERLRAGEPPPTY